MTHAARHSILMNVVQAAIENAAHAARTGHIFTGLEASSKRALICSECPQLEIVNGNERCKHKDCGGYLVTKRRLPGQHCPLGFW